MCVARLVFVCVSVSVCFWVEWLCVYVCVCLWGCVGCLRLMSSAFSTGSRGLVMQGVDWWWRNLTRCHPSHQVQTTLLHKQIDDDKWSQRSHGFTKTQNLFKRNGSLFGWSKNHVKYDSTNYIDSTVYEICRWFVLLTVRYCLYEVHATR